MGTSPLIANLRSMSPSIGPSMLACDFGQLEQEIRLLEDAGAGVLHLDIMDGHFVPNLSFGIPVVQAIRRATKLPLDVHLMISEPARYIEPFRNAGADLLTFHIETVPDPTELLGRIRKLGASAGLALSPATDISTIEPYLDQCDLVLSMSVAPGFGGQTFQPVALEKLRRFRELSDDMLLSVDGGVDSETIGSCTAAGADLLVVGTALLHHHDYHARMDELSTLARSSFGDVNKSS